MTYPSLNAFYASDERRRRSRERDIGLYWRGRGGASYRAAWVQATGELYLLEHGRPECRGGRVRLLADRYSASDVDRVFAGWRDVCGRPRSLNWLLARAQISSASRPLAASGARRGSGSTSSKPARRTPSSLTGLVGA